jgi:hypothetical protein
MVCFTENYGESLKWMIFGTPKNGKPPDPAISWGVGNIRSTNCLFLGSMWRDVEGMSERIIRVLQYRMVHLP